jgi:hypothetical protein
MTDDAAGVGDGWTDGNRLAGPLAEVFGVEVTTMVGRCAGCGAVRPLAEAHVFDRGPGVVARCSSCDQALLRMVRGPDRAWLDVRGLTYLEVTVG